MADVTLRDLDDDLVAALRARAEARGRSLEQELQLVLAASVEPAPADPERPTDLEAVRREWQAFIASNLVRSVASWPGRPGIPGPWKTLETHEAARVLTDLTQYEYATDRRPVCEAYAPQAVRAMPLSVYRLYLLCEVLLKTEEGPGIMAFLYGPMGMCILDLTTAPFVKMNARMPPDLRNVVEARRYLRLYASYVRDKRGRFALVESVNDLPPFAPGAPMKPEHFASHITSIASREGPTPEHGFDRYFEATVLFGDELLRSMFRIASDGTIDMLDAEVIATELPVRLESYMGALRLP